LIFGSAAAVGAGLAVNVDHTIGHGTVRSLAAAASFTVPMAVFLVAVWLLHWLPHHAGAWHNALAPVFAVAVLLTTFTPRPVLLTGVLMAALVSAGTRLRLDAAGR
jgi:hypothetical protein